MKFATPDTWYETKTLHDGVTHIYEPHIVEWCRCNIWHVRGRERDMLVDSGMGVVSLRDQVAIVSERALTAVTTHTHFDHIGSHFEFDDRIVHADEAEILANPTRENTVAADYVSDNIFTMLPPPPYSSEKYSVKAAPATRVVEDGDIIDLGDRHFEVLHTPGHSIGSISLWEEKTGILFSGDTIYDGPLLDGDYEGYESDYTASMERLLKIPVQIVYGGHFPSHSGERHRELIIAWLGR